MAPILVRDICGVMEDIAPLALAEDWDNVGLLVGNRDAAVTKLATCLTLSSDVVARIVANGVDMVVTHHPLPFRPLTKLVAEDGTGSRLLRLIQSRVAVYSAHTAFDSAAGGINASWAQRLNLQDVKPLRPSRDDPHVGGGRFGSLTAPIPLSELAAQCGPRERMRIVGEPSQPRSRIAVACGSGGSFLSDAISCGCDALVTGEATYHTAMEARDAGVAIVLTGHFLSERFAMESLAERLRERLAGCAIAAAVEFDTSTPLGLS